MLEILTLSAQELNFIRQNTGVLSEKEMADRLGLSEWRVMAAVDQLVRPGNGRGRPKRILSPPEIAFIGDNAGKLTHHQIARRLGVSARLVAAAAAGLGLEKKSITKISPEAGAFIKENLGGMSHAAMARHLGLAQPTISQFLRRNGLMADSLKRVRSFLPLMSNFFGRSLVDYLPERSQSTWM